MSRRVNALILVIVMAVAPLVPLASAHPNIGLSTDVNHVILSPGEATNITLTIDNNGSTIETYSVAVSGFDSVWEIIPADSNVTNVIPTLSASTTTAVRLATNALPSNSGTLTITVTEPDANISSTIDVLISVQARYLPAIDASSAGDNGLVQMAPGDELNLSISVTNNGNVDDTILLSVDQTPDLAGFWANWTTSGNQSNNSSNNGTGNNSSSGNTTILNNVLMFGNSYTQSNNLNLMLEDFGIVNADAITSGGQKLSGHWNNVNTPSHVSNTTLRDINTAWDYVILQDQSQVPGFYRSNSDWIDSKNGAVSLAGAIDDESSEAVLMMTWGRRSGDTNNPTMYSNFSVMQDRLEDGYIDYRDNMSNSTIDVWIAPVGLAFQHIHDAVNASGTDPTTSGNTFYDLYSSDGSHPSLSGSYLAACVLYATMTGSSPVGSNDSISLASSLKLELQQAAAATVFNETSHLSYPWQNNNATTLMSSPQGWEVRFLDDTMDNMSAGETRMATLKVSIPANENPGYYGFELFAASALGNFSLSTTMVVNVTAVHDLSFTHIAGDMLLPGANTTSTIQITSLSTADGDWTWQTGIISGNCSAHLADLQTMIPASGTYDIEIEIIASANTHVNDECEVSLQGILDIDSSIMEDYQFSVTVGEMWALSMVLPTSIKLDVDEAETFNVVVSNDGTEEDTISLIGIDSEGVTFTNPSPVTLARGTSVYVVMEVMIDSALVGNITLDFTMSSTNSGVGSINESGLFEVKEYAELTMTGPADGRIVITPGQNSSVMLNVSNDGTRDLELSVSISGLPNGITVLQGIENLNLDAGSSSDIELELLAASGLQPSSATFTITFDGGWSSTQLTMDLQIADRHEVLVDSSEDRIIASPLSDSNLTVLITNLGTSTETFVANIDNSQVNDWFTISVDTLSLTLESGQSGSITLSAREISAGAPVSGSPLIITITSTADSEVTDSLEIEIVPQVADGLITVMSDDDEAEPGEAIYGNVIITNLGTATDSMTIDTVEMDCNIDDVAIELAPSMSSSPIPWSCTIGENENAGMNALTFRLTSATRSNMMVTVTEAYTVEPTWSNNVIAFTFDKNDLVFDESIEQQTISITICNQANTYVEGSLELIGKNEPQMDGLFYRAGETGINSTYSLASNGCQDFRLMLTPLNLDGFDAVLTINSVSQVEGQTVRDVSPELRAEVAGPHLPPDGLNLGLFELDNKNSLILLSTGWVLSLLLLAYIRLFRKPVAEEEEEEEEEIPLGPNEVRVDEYNKVTCCSCEARLGVPEGSEPPFRFTCPKCDTRIRVVE